MHVIDLRLARPWTNGTDLFGNRLLRQRQGGQHPARRQHAAQRLGRAHPLTRPHPINDETRQMSERVDQQVECLQRRLVGPLQVVRDQQHRPLGRQVLQYPPHAVDQVADAGRPPVDQVGQHLARSVEGMRARPPVGQRPEPVTRQTVGDRRAQRGAASVEHPPARARRLLPCMSQQAGLSDPRRPFDRHQAASSTCGARDQPPQDRDLTIAFIQGCPHHAVRLGTLVGTVIQNVRIDGDWPVSMIRADGFTRAKARNHWGCAPGTPVNGGHTARRLARAALARTGSRGRPVGRRHGRP